MPDRTEIFKQVKRYYDSLQADNASLMRRKKEKLYAVCPRIEEIDREISSAGINAAKNAILSGKNAMEYMHEAQKKIDLLKNEKISLMLKNGFPENYLEPVYKCPNCKDTGFIGNEKCSCFTQKTVDLAYNNSNMRDIIDEENFENFNINFYSNEVDDFEGISPRENMSIILNRCYDFAKNFGNGTGNLLFYGRAGLGKTFLCSCIAREVLNKGYTVLYSTAGQLFKSVEKERFNRGNDDDVKEMNFSEDLFNVDLLIIDDLGTEFSTVLTTSEFFDILNTRLICNKSVIISTNLSIEDIQNKYSDRISSRIIGEYETYKFFGEDIRFIKKFGY